jgi:hypothetical protein
LEVLGGGGGGSGEGEKYFKNILLETSNIELSIRILHRKQVCIATCTKKLFVITIRETLLTKGLRRNKENQKDRQVNYEKQYEMMNYC